MQQVTQILASIERELARDLKALLECQSKASLELIALQNVSYNRSCKSTEYKWSKHLKQLESILGLCKYTHAS
jgi:hypothetical protein